MADYFTRFSLVLPLPDEAARADALDLANKASSMSQGEEAPDNFPPSLAAVIEDWQFETDADRSPGQWRLSLHSVYGGIDAVCAFIQHLLREFNPTGRVAFEWSHDCSKPRTDAFGGGAAFITSTEIETFSTSEWLQKMTC